MLRFLEGKGSENILIGNEAKLVIYQQFSAVKIPKKYSNKKNADMTDFSNIFC